MGNEDILKSMEAEQTSIEEEFNKVKQDLDTLEANYSNMKTQLLTRAHQLQGAYAVLDEQIKKYKKPSEEKEDNKVVPVQKEPKKENKTSVSKTTNKKVVKEEVKEEVKEKVVAGLTPEEIAKINQAVPKKGATDTNGNEIPDYLQTEYNK